MTTKANAPALLDIITRHQVYLEGVKEYEYSHYNDMAIQLRKDIREVFMEVEYADMSSFTKRELEDFIRKLKMVQFIRFNTYIVQVLRDLENFTAIDTEVNVKILRATQEELEPATETFDEKADEKLALLLALKGTAAVWAKVLSTPIQANGIYVEPYLKMIQNRANIETENLMRKARASNMTVAAALVSLIGTSRLNYREGLLTRLKPQADGTVATIWQHVAGIVQANVMPTIFDLYRWRAILDKQTSPLCRDLDGQVFSYGAGPLPPAHPRCRSTTEPVDTAEGGLDDMSYYAWMQAQPEEFQADVLGEVFAADLRAGKLSSEQLPRFSNADPLTPEQFGGKLKLMLA